MNESNITPSVTLNALSAMTDFVAFERLCCDILSGYGGYASIVPQGVGTKDGGKDGLLIDRTTNSQTTVYRKLVFHFSLRRKFETKLREDLEKVHKNNLQPNMVVFVTNRRWPPLSQDNFKDWCKNVYGWDLEIYDQEWLRIPLDGGYQAIRKRYLGIAYDLAIFQDLEDRLEILHRHPNRKDLEEGVYYRRESLHKDIDYYLKEKSRCLILSKPGCGKTALATAVGFEFLQADPQHSVFYVSAKQHGNCNEWIEQIRRFNHPHVLFIIDDCHVAIDAVNEFVEQFQTLERARLILISRIFDPDRGGTSDENFLEILKPVTVSFEIDEDTLANILKRLCRREKIPKEEIGDLTVIIKRCEGDLHLLNFLVRAWTINKKRVSSLADVDEDLILDEVFRRYIKNSAKNIEYIICIATLSQFEIPIEARWFDSEEIIDELQKDAWVDSFLTEVDGQPIHFLQYFHSTPAKLLLQACSKKGRLQSNVDVFTFDFLKRYLSCQPINFFDLFLQLYRNGRSDLQYALLDDGLPFQILLRMHNDRVGLLSNQWVFNLSRFIYAVWIWEGKKKQGKAYELLHTLLKASDDTYWSEMAKTLKLHVIVACSTYLFRIDKNFIDRVIKNLNFNELGQQSSEVGLATIAGFLKQSLRANVERNHLNEFCNSLDYQELGKRSRDVGLATINNFLICTNQAGVDTYHLNEFCTGLNFRDLGERSRVAGLCTITHFLMRVQQAKVTPNRINKFCTCLGFQELGIQSSGLGLSTIKNFIMRANEAGVNSDCLNEFCTGLNFYELGRRSQDVGLPTIMKFFQTIYRSGIKKENYASFCGGLDWHKLGRALKKRGERGSYLAEFSLVIYQPLVDRTMARDFVTGMGWDYIKRLTEFYFSPDALAAIRMLLLTKCEFTPQELTGNGIYLCPESDIWFTSFCQRPCSSKDKRVLKSQTNFLNYALNYFKSQHKRGHLCYNSLDLKAWNILIQNLSLADSKFVETTIVPILSSFDDQTFEFLFRNSDLRNIGTFFSLFAPRKGPFTWHLSNGIDYRNIDLCPKIDKALLREVALFLFAPQFLGNKDLSEQVAQHIQKQWEIFLPQTMDADLKTVEFFLWNLLLALPSHEKLTLLPQLIVAIEKKANESPVDAESLLAMLGILHFIEEQEAQQKLSHFINTQQAIAICRRATRNPSPRLIRLLYGLMFLLPELPLNKDRELFRRGLNSLDMTLKISMQESALSGLRAWIDTA